MVVVVVLCFTLTDRASTIPSINIHVIANPVRGLLDRKDRRNIYKAPTGAKKQNKNNKKKGTITQSICQIERV